MGFEAGNKIKFKHGMCGTKVYYAYCAMKTRCYRKKNPNYQYYGAKGITVCDSWKDDFTNFYRDMGDPPTKKHSLDRIDNEGNYCKDNCKWSTTQEQNLNKRQSIKSKKNKTGFRGVYGEAEDGKFTSMIRGAHIGTFTTPKEAALAYNKKATELYGNKAILNEV